MSLRRATLALGGGGARGVAHLGVFQALQEHNVGINRIIGVSAGSMAGGMIAFEPDVEKLKSRALDYLLSDTFQQHQRRLFGSSHRPSREEDSRFYSWYQKLARIVRKNRAMYRGSFLPSLLSSQILDEVLEHLLPDVDIADAPTPLHIVTADLLSGHPVVFDRGPLRLLSKASSSLPGIFPPVEYEGMLLVDVGVCCSLPVMTALTYDPKHLIAVDVSSGIRPRTECNTAFDVMMRMDEIGENMLRQAVEDGADLIIRPQVGDIEWFDFSTSADVIQAGYDAAIHAIEESHAGSQLWQRWLNLLPIPQTPTSKLKSNIRRFR